MSKVTVEVSAKNNVRAGLDAARNDLNKWKKDTEGGFLKLERDNKVKSNIVGLGQDLSQATSGTEALAAAGNRLGDVFQNSLGTAIAIGFGVQIVSAIAAADKELENFNMRMDELAGSMQHVGSLEAGALQGTFQNLKQRIAENKKDIEGSANIFSGFADAFSYDYSTGTDAGDRRMQEQAKLRESELQVSEEIASRMSESATVAELKAAGENDAADALERQIKHARELKEIQLNAPDRATRHAMMAASERKFAAESLMLEQKGMKPQGGVVANSLQEVGGGGRAMSFFVGDTASIAREQLAVQQQMLAHLKAQNPSLSATGATIPIKSFDYKP